MSLFKGSKLVKEPFKNIKKNKKHLKFLKCSLIVLEDVLGHLRTYILLKIMRSQLITVHELFLFGEENCVWGDRPV